MLESNHSLVAIAGEVPPLFHSVGANLNRVQNSIEKTPYQNAALATVADSLARASRLYRRQGIQTEHCRHLGLWLLTLASAFLTLPYLLYVIILAIVPDIDRLTRPKLRVALLGILLVMGVAGFMIGKNHPRFLTCENFKVGGHDIPANCRKAGEATH